MWFSLGENHAGFFASLCTYCEMLYRPWEGSGEAETLRSRAN